MNKLCQILLLSLAGAAAVSALPATFSKCDLNQDGATNVADVQTLLNEVFGSKPAKDDLNADGVVNVVDVQIEIDAALNLGCSIGPVPSISDFTPKSGPIGTAVTITGTNFLAAPYVTMPGQTGGTIVQPLTSFSAGSITFVVASGSATGPISVGNGFNTAVTTIPFTVSASSSFTLSASPAAATLIQGQSISYALTLTGANGFDQLAAISVTGAPAGVTLSLSPASITAGQTAVLTAKAPAGQPVAASSLTVKATATVEGIALTQTAPLSLSVVAPTTSFIGRTVVSDSVETPLAGVTVTTLGLDGSGSTTGCINHTVVSDAAGNFALTNLSASCAGPQLIGFNGNTVTSPPGTYAGVNLVFTLVSGQVVVSPVLVHMPRIDNVETFQVQQNAGADQTYAFKSIPGLQVTVYAGTTFTESNGSTPNPFPLAAIEVPVDRLPDQMPLTNSMVTAFIVAFQPANTSANKAVAVWFPNTLNTPPGTDVPLMTLDPTRGRMVAYGTGTVSNDGTTIVPDVDPSTGSLQHRFGIQHFDWHGPATNPPPKVNPPVDPCAPKIGKPVDLASGVEVLTSTDLVLNGNRGSIAIVRSYRSIDGQLRAFGIGGRFNYDYRLDSLTPQSAAVVNLEMPDGAQVPFNRRPDGTLTNTTTPLMAGAVMTTAADGSTSIRWRNGDTYSFVPGNLPSGSVIVQMADSNGNTTTIDRVPGLPQAIADITDPVGRKLIFAYDGTNRITSITDPIGRTVRYTYNANGTLATFTNTLGGVSSYQYDSQNRLTQVTDPRGVILARNTYDANGRVIQQVIDSGGVYQYAYTLTNALVPTSPVVQTVVTDPRGNVTTYRFNTQGFVVSATDPNGQTRVFTRQDGTNLVLAATGPGNCQLCGSTGAGDMTYTYDSFGNRLTETDALGHTATYTYDPTFNRTTSITDAAGNLTKISYDAAGNPKTITDPNNNTSILNISPEGLLLSATDPAGNTTQYTFNALGDAIKETNALNQVTSFSYDAVSRLVAELDPLGEQHKATYNSLDEMLTEIDPNGSSTTMTYDLAGGLTGYTTPTGGAVKFSFDSAGRLSTRTDQLNNAETFAYDLSDNAVGVTNRRGQHAVFTYDSLDRLSAEQYADSAQVQRTYDSSGRLVQVVDSTVGPFNMNYDLAGRLVKSVSPFGAVTYIYDQDDRVVTRQVQGQPALNYTYDAAGNLVNAAMGGIAIGRTFDARNLLQSLSRSNGVTGGYSYDALGRLTSISEARSGGPVLVSRNLTYDAAGRVAGQSLGSGAPLATASSASAFNTADQIVSNTGSTYVHDADGERISETSAAGTTTYLWDARGRLVSIDAPGGMTTSFLYDYNGNMIQKSVASNGISTVERYVLDDRTNALSQEVVGTGVSSLLTGRGVDQQWAMLTGSAQSFPLMDHLGSTVAVTDGAGTVTGSASYEPYGATASTGTSYPLAFTARPQVAPNLYYLRARFLDTQNGRFLSEDPAGLAGGSSNLFSYVNDNPEGLVDPTGEYAIVKQSGNHVLIYLPIRYQGAGATQDVINKFNRGIEQAWTGNFGDFHVRVLAYVPGPDCAPANTNTIQVPVGNTRAFVDWAGGYTGTWPSRRPAWTAAHESGHLMGLPDEYHRVTGVPFPGWENDMMAVRDMPPSARDIQAILDAHRDVMRPEK